MYLMPTIFKLNFVQYTIKHGELVNYKTFKLKVYFYFKYKKKKINIQII